MFYGSIACGRSKGGVLQHLNNLCEYIAKDLINSLKSAYARKILAERPKRSLAGEDVSRGNKIVG